VSSFFFSHRVQLHVIELRRDKRTKYKGLEAGAAKNKRKKTTKHKNEKLKQD
jgi:hypothetical protein